MNVDSASEWTPVTTSELLPGDFFSARIGATEVMGILAQQEEERFGLVLSHRGDDADLARFPPPAGRSLGTLGFRQLKFTGRAIARPRVEAPDPEGGGFPGLRTAADHGDLLVDLEGAPWVFVRDHLTETQVLDFFVNLKTGLVGQPAGGALHANWELIALREGDKPGPVLVRIGT